MLLVSAAEEAAKAQNFALGLLIFIGVIAVGVGAGVVVARLAPAAAGAMPFVAWAAANGALACLTLAGVSVAGSMVGWFAIGSGMLALTAAGHE